MLEKVLELIQLVIEKYMLDTVISFIVSGLIFLFTPEDYWMLNKLGIEWYVIFIAGCIFILIQIPKTIHEKANEKIQYAQEQEYINKERSAELYRNIKILWDMIDSFSQEDIKIIKQLIENKNKPITKQNYYYMVGGLLDSELIDKRINNQTFPHCMQYKLKDEVYQLIMYSIEKYGKISNFEEI